MIARMLRQLFGGKQVPPSSAQAKEGLSIHELAESSGGLVVGYELCVTMQPRVPLSLLARHGEVQPSIPKGETDPSNPFFIWLPKTKSEYDFLSEGATMASSVGPIPRDGGTFLPFLLELRAILERPRDSQLSDYEDAETRTTEILSLGVPDSGEYLKKLYDSSRERIFGFVLGEIGESTVEGFSSEHLEQLYSDGFKSTTSMIAAEDSVLLGLKGIGPSRLVKIRSNQFKDGEQSVAPKSDRAGG